MNETPAFAGVTNGAGGAISRPFLYAVYTGSDYRIATSQRAYSPPQRASISASWTKPLRS
jgi:hypothetical protein